MIQNIIYLLVIAALLGLAGHFAERICAALHWPRRIVWAAALALSVTLPAYMFIADQREPAPFEQTEFLIPLGGIQLPQTAGVVNAILGKEAPETGTTDWSFLDQPLMLTWAGASLALVLVYLLAGAHMQGRLRNSAQNVTIQGAPVLLTESIGPAVIGFLRPRIVLPRWLATQDSRLLAHVLRHERAHLIARDQLTLLFGLAIVAAMPWNPAVWWQFRKLRAAIEMDCDSRVLKAGVSAREYSEALLHVGQHAVQTPFAAVALFEHRSELERRIRIMVQNARRPGLVATGSGAVALVAMLLVACSVQAPQGRPAIGDGPPGAAGASEPLPPLRLELQDAFTRAQECIEDSQDIECAEAEIESVNRMRNLNAHEQAQLLNFTALVSFEKDDTAGAIAAFEAVRELPIEQMPAGLASAAYRNLASLYLEAGRYEDGLAAFDRWLALPFITGTARDSFFRAQMLYVLGDYPAALEETERAISSGDEPQPHWYNQLYALQLRTGDQAAAARTLDIFRTNWPDRNIGTGDQLALPGSEQNPVADSARRGVMEPIVKSPPIYPPAAIGRRLEGYVIVEFTVDASGATKDLEVVESSDPIFEESALAAVEEYEYRPRSIDDVLIEIPGVRVRLEYALE